MPKADGIGVWLIVGIGTLAYGGLEIGTRAVGRYIEGE